MIRAGLNLVTEQHPRKQGLKLYGVNVMIRALNRHRATSTKTRIETRNIAILLHVLDVTEQHPRKQGLKLVCSNPGESSGGVTEQHPRKQGLKLWEWERPDSHHPRVTEQHPRKQGLKQNRFPRTPLEYTVTEQHPRIQGLKPKPASLWPTIF